MGLTRNDKQRIQELQENFETDENLQIRQVKVIDIGGV